MQQWNVVRFNPSALARFHPQCVVGQAHCCMEAAVVQRQAHILAGVVAPSKRRRRGVATTGGSEKDSVPELFGA